MTEQKKYELTSETIEHDGVTLHRIKALIDIPKHGIIAGSLGGFVENESNLSHKESAWIGGNAKVWEYANVYGNAYVSGNAQVWGNAEIFENAYVHNNAKVFDTAWVYGEAIVRDEATVCGDCSIAECAAIEDDAHIYGTAAVNHNANIAKDAVISDAEHFIVIGPIGSEGGTLTIYRTENDVGINRGCFTGTLDEFEEAVKHTHGKSIYGKEYKLIIKLARMREKQWHS